MQKKRETFLRKNFFFENVLEKNIFRKSFFSKNYCKKTFFEKIFIKFYKPGAIIRFFRVALAIWKPQKGKKIAPQGFMKSIFQKKVFSGNHEEQRN